MPPSCISFHQLPFPDSLIMAQLASPAQVIGHIGLAPARQDTRRPREVQDCQLFMRLLSFLSFPSLHLSASLCRRSELDCCEIIQKTRQVSPTTPSRPAPLATPPAGTSVPSLKHPFEFVTVILSGLIGSERVRARLDSPFLPSARCLR